MDLAGDEPEHQVAERMQAVEDQVEDHRFIERALLTLSRPGAEPLRVGAQAPPRAVD